MLLVGRREGKAPRRGRGNIAPVIVVYHPNYLFGSTLLNAMHPFQFDRASQVEVMLREQMGAEWPALLRQPTAPASMAELAAVHDKRYLDRAHHSSVIARIIEVNSLFWCPRFLMKRWFVTPSLWGAAGTLLAARQVLKEGLAMNLGGGYHHAKRRWGEGFCLFSDIALAIHTMRTEGLLAPTDGIFYIDLDVHQGNGVSADFAADPAVRILDLFNDNIYPCRDKEGRAGIDVARPLPSDTGDEVYLKALRSGLDELFEGQPLPRLVIYNAGTDVYHEDVLGDMKLSSEGVNLRDQMVLEAVRGRGLPLLTLASGGYSATSARLITDFVLAAHRYEGGLASSGG